MWLEDCRLPRSQATRLWEASGEEETWCWVSGWNISCGQGRYKTSVLSNRLNHCQVGPWERKGESGRSLYELRQVLKICSGNTNPFLWTACGADMELLCDVICLDSLCCRHFCRSPSGYRLLAYADDIAESNWEPKSRFHARMLQNKMISETEFNRVHVSDAHISSPIAAIPILKYRLHL